MIRFTTTLLTTLVCMTALVLTGCGKQEEAPPAPQGSSRLPDDSVFKDQVRALDKAEGVQKTLDDAVAKQREEIERTSR